MPGVKFVNILDACFETIIGDGAIVSYSNGPTPSVAVHVTAVSVTKHVTAGELNAKSVGGSKATIVIF